METLYVIFIVSLLSSIISLTINSFMNYKEFISIENKLKGNTITWKYDDNVNLSGKIVGLDTHKSVLIVERRHKGIKRYFVNIKNIIR